MKHIQQTQFNQSVSYIITDKIPYKEKATLMITPVIKENVTRKIYTSDRIDLKYKADVKRIITLHIEITILPSW